MLILTGITINLLFGDNGIITKTKMAKKAFLGEDVREVVEDRVNAYITEYGSKGELDLFDFWAMYNSAYLLDEEGEVIKDGEEHPISNPNYEENFVIYLFEDVGVAFNPPINVYTKKDTYTSAVVIYKGYQATVNKNLTVAKTVKEVTKLEDISPDLAEDLENEIIEQGLISATQYRINNTTLTFNKIVVVGENETVKTLKDAFDYLCDNNFKDNVAIVLREGAYTTQTMQTGTGDNLNSKYDKMNVSIIADKPGKVFLSPGEMGMTQNGTQYGITLKFYRIVFNNANGNFHMNMDSQTKEYYNCVINTAYGGYNYVSNTSVKLENCLFNSNVNSFYNYKLSGTATNCASIDGNMEPANGIKTTCLNNVSVDSKFKITSNGWEHTGTGTNPDGTQANIGVYGGEFAWTYLGATISLSNSGTLSSTDIVKATVTHNGSQGIKIGECKWVLNSSREELGTDSSSYTGGTFTSNGQEITVGSNLEDGRYYLHVLSVDKAGNKEETIYQIRVGNTALTQYVIFEIDGYIATGAGTSNCAAINEIEVYNGYNQKNSYTISTAYDSSTSSIPAYWNYSVWNKSNLNDNNTAYGDGTSTTFFGSTSSSISSTVWSRLLLKFSSEIDIGNIKVYVGDNHGRTPRAIKAYIPTTNLTEDQLSTMCQSQTETNLEMIGSKSFTESVTTSTAFDIYP